MTVLPSITTEDTLRPRIPVARDRLSLLIVALAIGLYILNVVSLYPLTVDDGYIVLRYAHNLVVHGVLEFNLGERVASAPCIL